MIKHIIFDLDGVLVDARELHYEALNQALAKFGFTITRDEHLSTYDGLPTRRKLELLTEKRGLPTNLYDAVWQEKQSATQHIISTSFTYDERLRDILQQLRQDGFTLSVCSNSVLETVKTMLAYKGLVKFFDFYLSNEDVQQPKPHPEIYLRAFVRLGAAPAECLVIEDSHRGREAAQAAGAILCGVRGPADVTYELIRRAIDQANHRTKYQIAMTKWQGGDMRIVIPMAGAGKSYIRAGYTFPKPLVDIGGKPMIQWVVENINADGQFIFIVQKEQYEQYNLKYLLNLIAPGCAIVQLEQPTQGAALSVLAAEPLFNNDYPLAVVNSDQVVEWNSNEFFYAMAADACDAGLVTFTATHPKWSYVRTGENGFVIEAAEKKPISNQATAGIYYFARGHEFAYYTRQMIHKGVMTNNEYYICPVFNEYVTDQKKIRPFPVERVWSFSTPEDLPEFIKFRHTTQQLPQWTSAAVSTAPDQTKAIP